MNFAKENLQVVNPNPKKYFYFENWKIKAFIPENMDLDPYYKSPKSIAEDDFPCSYLIAKCTESSPKSIAEDDFPCSYLIAKCTESLKI
ncbi:hypothetical protein QE152_g34974 [Popillia japonica]|uniref:Uncharacterized protein n=1 Tax=Popillia japonica TaxID=7064 RepID=A0AAW1IT29_POPJA